MFFLKIQHLGLKPDKLIMRAVLAQPAVMEASISRLTIGATTRSLNQSPLTETLQTWGRQVLPGAPYCLARVKALAPVQTPINRGIMEEWNSSFKRIWNQTMISPLHLSQQSCKEFWTTVQLTRSAGIIMITLTHWAKETTISESNIIV